MEAGSTVKSENTGLINIRKEEIKKEGGTRWDVVEPSNMDFYANWFVPKRLVNHKAIEFNEQL